MGAMQALGIRTAPPHFTPLGPRITLRSDQYIFSCILRWSIKNFKYFHYRKTNHILHKT